MKTIKRKTINTVQYNTARPRQPYTHASIHRVPKKEATKLLPITFLNLNRFSKFFHCWIEDEYFQQNCVIFSTTPQLCCCTTWGKLIVQIYCKLQQKKIKKRVIFDKNEMFMLSYSWLEIGVLFYSICSKCPPFACTHARKRLCHLSMHCQWCSGRRYATFAVHTVSVHQCRAPATGTLAVGWRSKSCNQPD